MHPIVYGKLTESVVVCHNREYGTIDDVDIDLHINISFLDVSQQFCPYTPRPSSAITALTLTFN